jgi:hypothetical protein
LSRQETSEERVKVEEESGGGWSIADFDRFVGLPWEPYPGARGRLELRSKVRLPAGEAELTDIVKGKSALARRRFRVREGFGDGWAHGGMPGMQSSKQRCDSDEPFGGSQKKGCRRIQECSR